MTQNEATDETTTATAAEAIREVRAHGFTAEQRGRDLVDVASGERIAAIDDGGDVHTADIMRWLGY